LYEEYKKSVSKELVTELNRGNPFSIPKITKVVVSMGIGKNKGDKGFIESAIADMTTITGQKPKVAKAKKSISGFKLREGEPVGLFVTLRGTRMWEFLDKLFNVALPRVRDFRGVSEKSFDGFGNFTLGVTEHTMFPEVDPNKVDKIKSLAVSINTTARNNEEGRLLLEKLGLPLRKR